MTPPNDIPSQAAQTRSTAFPLTIEAPWLENHPAPSDAPDIVFHHFPKTAGSTFRQILSSLVREDEVCPAEIDDEIRTLSPTERKTFRLYGGHFSFRMISEEFQENAIWLTFVRNPIDRVISNYYNLVDIKRHQPQWLERLETRPAVKRYIERVQGASLEEFVFLDDPRTHDRITNRMTRYLTTAGGDPMNPSSTDRYPRYDSEIIAQAKKNLETKFAFCGVQELFDMSLQNFALTFGIRPFSDAKSFTVNINPKKSSSEYEIPDNVREHLEDCNKMDFELWEFAQSLLWERHLRATQAATESHYLIRRDRALRGRVPVLERGDTASIHARDFDNLRGFHRLESNDEGHVFAWTGYDANAVVEWRVQLAETDDVRVEIDVLAEIAEGIAQDTELRLDDAAPRDQRCTTADDGMLQVIGHWRHADLRDGCVHTLRLFPQRMREPDDAPHPRMLGFAFSEARIGLL